MSCYSIPAMTMENEFVDLVFLGGYVDNLVKKFGNDYAIVYEWGDDGLGEGMPVAVLARLSASWSRHPVPGSGK